MWGRGAIPLHLPNRILCVTISFPKNCADFEIWIMRHAVHPFHDSHALFLDTQVHFACAFQHPTHERKVCVYTHICRRSYWYGYLTVQYTTPGRIPLRPTTPDKGRHSTSRAHLCMHTSQRECGGKRKYVRPCIYIYIYIHKGNTHQPHAHTYTLHRAPPPGARRSGHLRTPACGGAHLHSHTTAPKENCSIQDSHVVPHRSTN